MIPLNIGRDSRGLPTYPTREGTKPEDRARIIEVVRPDLASCLDMVGISKQAHWNVKGYNFIAIHKLFDEIYDYIAGTSDVLAERITALGGTAQGGARFVVANSYIPMYPDQAVGCCEHLMAMADRLAILSNTMAMSIDKLDQIGSKVTSNIYQDIVHQLDKYLWFVEAHIQAPEHSEESYELTDTLKYDQS
jgi:starvation-inducible DNA-binding protein